jgi:hypothetical protein
MPVCVIMCLLLIAIPYVSALTLDDQSHTCCLQGDMKCSTSDCALEHVECMSSDVAAPVYRYSTKQLWSYDTPGMDDQPAFLAGNWIQVRTPYVAPSNALSVLYPPVHPTLQYCVLLI